MTRASTELSTRRGSTPAWLLRARNSGIATAALVALMWMLEAVDTLAFHALDRLGISSWDVGDLWSLATAPLVHVGWEHLANNSVLLLVLGFVLGLDGLRTWTFTTVVTALTSGLAAWLLSAPGTNTLGASGVVFGWLAFLLARGWFSRRIVDVLVSVVLAMAYGSVLWGVLPTAAGVSWQGHLGGALGGVLAASLVHGRDRRA